MKKQILLPPAQMRELRETFKVSRSDLGRALTYQRNSGRARTLRAAAIQRGGLIYTGCHAPVGFCPDVETTHDHAQGVMRQKFGSRIELHIDTNTDVATIIIDGVKVATVEGMTLEKWSNTLFSLQQIYNRLNS